MGRACARAGDDRSAERGPGRVRALALCIACASMAGARAASAADVPDSAHDCLIEPMSVADVGSPVQGILAELLVERGETVARGQPIARLESGVEAATVEHAEARAAMQSEIAAREADLELAKLALARVENLHRQDLVPAQQRDEARVRRRVAGAALVQALENRQLLQLELQRAQRLLDQRTLRSPIDGVVVERLAFPGEFVYDNPIATLARIDPLRVEVVLPARLFGTIAPGDVASVFPELDAEADLVATVEVVDALLDTGSGTFGVRLVLPNADLAVPGGQRCRVAFDGAAARGTELADGEP